MCHKSLFYTWRGKKNYSVLSPRELHWPAQWELSFPDIIIIIIIIIIILEFDRNITAIKI